MILNPIPSIFCIAQDINDELRRALKHPPMHSAHEAYAIIQEEVYEFWDEVKKKAECRDRANMRLELVQIAAMAVRAIIDLQLEHEGANK